MEEKKYVRVSEILAKFKNFDHIDFSILEAKQILGTNVHDAIKDTILDEFPCVNEKERKYLKSFEKWSDQINPVFKVIEKRLYDDTLMITGKPDALLRLKGHSKNVLVDWKCTAQQDESVWRMQGHFYHYLFKVNGFEDLDDRFLFIKLDKEGKMPKVYEYKYDHNIMNMCILEVEKYWSTNKSVDYNYTKV